MSNEKNSEQTRSAKDSFNELCRILNKPRPYRSSDFKPQHFIPDLIVVFLMTLSFYCSCAAKVKTTEPKAKQFVAPAHQQSRANYINYVTALQKIRGR